MRIISANVTNFGSYKELSFNFENKSLTLVSGPTGSGKSTLCDIIPWGLFGRTAKGGAADEVIGWNSSGATECYLTLGIKGRILTIRRARGPNDLSFRFSDDVVPATRGKDLLDTQKLINEIIGMNADTYLSGAYFHEFSQAAQFFTTTAKNRRIVTEQLADLSLAKDLKAKSSSYSKELQSILEDAENELRSSIAAIKEIELSVHREEKMQASWTEATNKKIDELYYKTYNYEGLKAKSIKDLSHKEKSFESERSDTITSMMHEYESLLAQVLPESYFQEQEKILKHKESKLDPTTCKECGSSKDNTNKLLLIREEHALSRKRTQQTQLNLDIDRLSRDMERAARRLNPYTAEIKNEEIRPNNYAEQLEQLTAQINPHIDALIEYKRRKQYLSENVDKFQQEISDVKLELDDLSTLSEVIDTLRATVIDRTVRYLEDTTNSYLESYFDAEIRIALEVTDSDKLEVSITKDGNQASFTQLSKGQRQILKLCFGTSVMKAISNYNGTSFNCLFYDEALDGMDDNTKLKAVGLLESLALTHESVFCVEHSEIVKAMFSNKIEVVLENGESIINE